MRSISDIFRTMRRSGLVALAILLVSGVACVKENVAPEDPTPIHENAGHAFMNPNHKEGYSAQATADAQQRIDRFFAAKLRANISNS